MFDRDLENYEEVKEMARCVQLYFRHQKQQQEIAKELGISTSKVSRLLKRAYSEGIIQVSINLPLLPGLATSLAERYRLRDAVVVPSGQVSDIKEELGIATARYFERIAGAGVKVGLSCGFTLYHVVKNLREGVIKDLKIYPLSAESTCRLVDIFPNTLVGMMAAKYRPDVTAYALHAQFVGPLEKVKQERQSLLKQAEIREIYNETHDVDIAIVGIGAIGPETPGFCTLAEHYGFPQSRLRAMGAVGEINYQPFDRQGNPIKKPELKNLLESVIAVSAEKLREITQKHGKHVIAVAGGLQKAEAVRAALKGGLCNVLVTDQEVAKVLLDK